MVKLIDKIFADNLFLRVLESMQSSEQNDKQLVNLRITLESIYKKITEDVKISFNGLFSRMQYVHEQFNFEQKIVSQVNLMRLLCNKMLHENDATMKPDELWSAYLAVVKLIEYVSEELPDPQIRNFLEKNQAQTFRERPRQARLDFCCVIESFSCSGDDQNLDILAINEYGERVSIQFRNDDIKQYPGRQWTKLSKSLWSFATLNCYNLSPVQGRELYYLSNPETLIVLEPDFLIDTSALAECFSQNSYHPEFFVINKLIQESGTDKTMQGKVVNSILDELIMDPEQDYDELFRRCLAENPIAMVALGLPAVTTIHSNVKKMQLPKLKDFALSHQDNEVLLEASYISPHYGLQGRLDLLTKQKDKYSIVELKSGKAPETQIWRQNQMQVVGYNMIVNHCYGRSNCANSSIFYSQSDKNPLRHVVNIRKMEQELMLCRNRIIGILHNLADEPKLFLDWLKDNHPNYDNPIHNNKIKHLRQALSRLKDYEYEWLLQQIRCIVSEVWFVKTGSATKSNNAIYGFNALWKQADSIKAENYSLLTDLSLKRHDSSSICFELTGDRCITNFRKGDIVVLYQKDKAVDKQELIRGKIVGLTEDELQLVIRGGIKKNQRFSEQKLWSVEHDLFESSLYSPLASVFTFITGDSKRAAIYLGIKEPRHNVCETIQSENHALDLITKIESALDYYIVQGPPGTGKTSGLLSTYIKKQYDNTSKNILVLSFTNRAIDEICQNFDKKNVQYIRTGASDFVEDKLLSTKIKGKNFREIESLIKSNRIWVSTVQSCNAWFSDLQKLVSIDELIVDEASQIIEASILGVISKVPKVILIGDQNQLPPIVVQPLRKISFSHPDLQDLQYSSYNQSLMERLYTCSVKNKWEKSRFMLYQHYRMHDMIAELITEYYDNKLCSVLDKQNREIDTILGDSFEAKVLSNRLVWLDTPASEHDHYDPNQIQLVAKLLSVILSSDGMKLENRDIGIITPFRAMNTAIIKSLPAHRQDISIDTVERYQGSERKIMIICLPLRSDNDLRMIQSLSADERIDRKLNVALSRAQDRIIIMGNSNICSSSVHYRNLIDKIRHKGILITKKEINNG